MTTQDQSPETSHSTLTLEEAVRNRIASLKAEARKGNDPGYGAGTRYAACAIEQVVAGFIGEAPEREPNQPSLPPALLGYQNRWVTDHSPIKVIAHARLIGITWATACEAVRVASSRFAEGGMDVYFMAASKDEARQFADYCVEWSPGSKVEEREGEKGVEYRIVFHRRFTITSADARQQRLRGKQGYVIFDQIMVGLNSALSTLAWGGRLALINPGDDFVRTVKSGEKRASLHEVFIYEALEDGLFGKICDVRKIECSAEAEAAWLADIRRAVGPAAFAEEFEGRRLADTKTAEPEPELKTEPERNSLSEEAEDVLRLALARLKEHARPASHHEASSFRLLAEGTVDLARLLEMLINIERR